MIPSRLVRLDQDLFQRVARSRAPAVLDRALPALSVAANRSALWMGIASVLAAAGDRSGRRAALRGLLAVGLTSLTVNLPAKLITRRRRPPISTVPIRRRVVRSPRSRSFPSGHSASAFAFAVGASLELPWLAGPIGTLAAAVASSRVYVGLHYPGDVIVGAVIGAGIGLATRRLWPLAPNQPAQMRRLTRRIRTDPSPRGEGVAVVVNPDAGPAFAANPAEKLREALPEARIIELDEGDDLVEALEEAAQGARVIGVCGGDGSVNAAAQLALRHELPLVVIPGGTLNHLARDLGLTSIADAVDAVRHGDVVAVDVATIDGKAFVNTASFGSYAALVDAREQLEPKIGKWPAVLVALVRLLRTSEPMQVEIDGESKKIWMIFIGNCQYRPNGFAPNRRERLDDGLLDIRMVYGHEPWSRTRLVLALLSGRLGKRRVYEERCASELTVQSADERRMRLARDGETFDGSPAFTVSKHDRPLPVYAPQEHEP